MQLNVEFKKIAMRVKKPFINEQYKEIEVNNRMEKSRDLFKKLEISRKYFVQGWA